MGEKAKEGDKRLVNKLKLPVEYKEWERTDILKAKKYMSNDFKTEKDLCDSLEYNIELVCKKLFNANYISHIREFRFSIYDNGNPSCDFLITTDKGIFCVECKNPKKRPQWAVFQSMKYMIYNEELSLGIDRFCVINTDFNLIDFKLIKKHNLPIELFFISKQKAVKFI